MPLPPIKIFNEREFLRDLAGHLVDNLELGDTEIEDSQIYILDREPAPEDLFSLVVPGLVLFPGRYAVIYGLGSIARIEPYPVNVWVLAEVRDTSDDSARWMDAMSGAAEMREAVARVAVSLGSSGDGAFAPSAGGRIDWVLPGEFGLPGTIAPESGNDICVAPLQLLYELEL